MPTASLVVTTHGWQEALAPCLRAISAQRVLPREVIVADDGRDGGDELLARHAPAFPTALRRVSGASPARRRNRALAASVGDYVIFIDEGLVLHPAFVADHLALARPGAYGIGGHAQANSEQTRACLAGGALRFGTGAGQRHRHVLHWPWLARHKTAAEPSRSMPVSTCNFGAWREDLLRVNGFDERMEGDRSEDLELELRLRNAGLSRRWLKYSALAFRLEGGAAAAADLERLSLPNSRLMLRTAGSRATWSVYGIQPGECAWPASGHPRPRAA
jgi:glycosyltransferase involved in cell wall biosynthesis